MSSSCVRLSNTELKRLANERTHELSTPTFASYIVTASELALLQSINELVHRSGLHQYDNEIEFLSEG
jgi:hypothetical protein